MFQICTSVEHGADEQLRMCQIPEVVSLGAYIHTNSSEDSLNLNLSSPNFDQSTLMSTEQVRDRAVCKKEKREKKTQMRAGKRLWCLGNLSISIPALSRSGSRRAGDYPSCHQMMNSCILLRIIAARTWTFLCVCTCFIAPVLGRSL